MDRDFRRLAHCEEQGRKGALPVFKSDWLLSFPHFHSEGLCKAPVTKKMERLMALWPNIETIASTIAGGAMFELPMKSTRLKQI